NVKMKSTASTQFGTAQAGTPSATGATSTIDVSAQNNLWDSVVQNVKEILRETDKIISAPSAAALASAAAAAPPPAAAGTAGAPGAVPQPAIPAAPALPQPSAIYQEAASVIANRESGVLYVRATSKQHEKVQEFLDQVLAGARRQVLIEATVAEVQLRNEYQRGITWERVRNGATGVSTGQPVIQPATSATPGFNTAPFFVGFLSSGGSFNVPPTIRRRVDSVTDPNPALQVTASNPNAVPNVIPVFETREFDSMLRLQSGQIGVLAGLMQDIVENTDTGIPGIRSIPIIGEILTNRSDLSRKSELVIFLRATVIQDPSLDGDFRGLRSQLPGEDFFSKPNPGKLEPPLPPRGWPAR